MYGRAPLFPTTIVPGILRYLPTTRMGASRLVQIQVCRAMVVAGDNGRRRKPNHVQWVPAAARKRRVGGINPNPPPPFPHQHTKQERTSPGNAVPCTPTLQKQIIAVTLQTATSTRTSTLPLPSCRRPPQYHHPPPPPRLSCWPNSKAGPWLSKAPVIVTGATRGLHATPIRLYHPKRRSWETLPVLVLLALSSILRVMTVRGMLLLLP